MNELLGNFKSVSQFEGRNGAVKNQFIIQTDKGLIYGNQKKKPNAR